MGMREDQPDECQDFSCPEAPKKKRRLRGIIDAGLLADPEILKDEWDNEYDKWWNDI